jgi:hypothetical protein
MVLQLCGRVCRRLSLKNPHHLFDGDFLRCDFLVYQEVCFFLFKWLIVICL